MLRHAGRAAAEIGLTLHRVCHFLLTLSILLSVAAVGCAWRLSRGPIDLDFMRDRIERGVNQSLGPVRVTIGGASIAWGGFSHGLDQPLVLRVSDLTIEAATGATRVHIPFAEAALSARWMLIGRILPRSITLRGAHLLVIRDADGSIGFGLGGQVDTVEPSPLSGLLAVLGAPRETDLQAGGGRLSQLSAVTIDGATLLLEDRRLGMTLSAEPAGIVLFRHRGGGIDGRARLDLAMGGQHSVLAGSFNVAPAGKSAHVAASLSQVTPKALAGAAPILALLARVDVPLTVDGEADLGPDLTPARIRVTARAGKGTVGIGDGTIPLRRAVFTIVGTPEQATVERAMIELQPAPGAAISTVNGTGRLTRRAGLIDAAVHVTLDHIDFADLPALWPACIAPSTREWITRNVREGTAHDGAADLVLEASDTASDVTLIQATATLEGDDLSVTWFPGVPPLERAGAHLVLTDPDKIEIDVKSARQSIHGAEAIAVPYGHVSISGMTTTDQVVTVHCEANGPIAGAIALLKEPRLRLLDRHPIEVNEPTGDARVTVRVVVPLLRNLLIDDIAIHVTGTLYKTHLSRVVAGRDLDDGVLLLDVDTNRASIKGTARLAGIPANIDGMLDFRAGPPSQLIQRLQVTGRPTAAALTDAGLNLSGALTGGDIGLKLALSEHRAGDGDLAVDADLTQAALAIPPLNWRKPIGDALKASANVVLSNDRLTGIDGLAIVGAEVRLRGTVTASEGKPDAVHLDRVMLGRTDVRGTIRLPRDGPIGVELTGPALDLSQRLLEKSPKREAAAPEPPPGPAWSMRGRFDRVFLAHDQIANHVDASGASDGQAIRALSITARSGSGKPFAIRIARGGVVRDSEATGRAVRRLSIDAEDAGSLLQGLDITEEIKGGVLTLAGEFDDKARNHTLSGTLGVTDFRVIHAPALGKLLQAVTFYGLFDALSGPGVHFSRLSAPFQLDNDTLMLHDAWAFSSSLGLTAKGTINRAAGRLDLEGTLVPAYVFNSVLGRIPLIGRLFSAETGGGLFAMNYSLQGPMDNPTVTANPLSALTPGILRGMFGLIGGRAPEARTRLDHPGAEGNVQQ